MERLAAAGAKIDPKRDDYPFGKFGWFWDPEGNRIELWEPLEH
jgi:predicted enzyme related to lactoylglutathione lyase